MIRRSPESGVFNPFNPKSTRRSTYSRWPDKFGHRLMVGQSSIALESEQLPEDKLDIHCGSGRICHHTLNRASG